MIKSKERVRKYGEVFTPDWLANDMWDAMDANIAECTPSSDINYTVLEPTCGEGVFLRIALERRLTRCSCDLERMRALAGLYGMDILDDNVLACRDTLRAIMRGAMGDWHKWAFGIDYVLMRNILCCDALAAMRGLNHEPMLDKRKKPMKGADGCVMYYPEITGFHVWTDEWFQKILDSNVAR